jgi:streptogramin lyase
VAMLGAVCAFAVFSVRAGVLASWGHPDLPAPATVGDVAQRDHGDVPDELLVYTQTSGDIPVLRDQVDKAAKESGLGDKLPIVVDSVDGYTWPWAWYLRDYKSVSYTAIAASYTPPQGAILFISKQSATNVNLGDGYNEGVPYHHRRWFPEEYRGADGKYSSRNFFSDLFSTKALGTWLDYWIRRTPPNELGTVDGVAFFPKGYSDLTAPPAGPTVRTDGTQLVIGGNGSAKGQFSGVSDVAIDAAGNLYFADTNNNRIEKYDAQGNFQSVAGGFGGEVQLNQPWSMTVAPDGTVFVADTWNHSITKLDKDLKKVKSWGSGCTTIPDCDETHLFGPRDIAVTPGGHVMIVDTGNNRAIEYDSDGNFVRQFGSKGSSGDPLQFNEPSSLAVAANGDIFIADFWNKRIVHLDKDLKSKGEIKVDAWGSQTVTDRGYLALLPDGRLLATDPTRGKVLAFAVDGTPIGEYDMPKEGAQTQARPIGIATDGTSVIVTDSIGNVARKIPLSEIIK